MKPMFARVFRVGSYLFCLSMGIVIGRSDAQEGTKVPQPTGQNPAQKAELLKTFASEFIHITPGKGQFPETFTMGAPQANEQPAHEVRMQAEFSIAKYEVPQDLYTAVAGTNPSVWGGPRNSVEMVTWADAKQFCRRATALMRQAGLIAKDEQIRLPSEAEWEYCCRAGTNTTFSFGDSATIPSDAGKKASLLDPYGWHTGNAAGNDPPVGALKPNAWGLYDMHGYLWEYVDDAFHATYENAPGDGTAWDAAKPFQDRLIRGGSWRDRHERLTSTTRASLPDHVRSDAIGFRCVKAKLPTDPP